MRNQHYRPVTDLLALFDVTNHLALVTYAREDVQKWLQNYHTKIEFFETYVTEGRIPLQATIAEILWYHTLRNEIYHSGNGMTPERYCLDGIRSAAIEVFDVLYSINACSLLSASISVAETTPEKSSTYIPAQSRFLQTYVAFERALSSSLLVLGAKNGNGITPVGELWSLLGSQMHVPDIHTRVVTEAAMVQGELVHSGYTKLTDYELEELASKLDEIIAFVQSYGVSFDILAVLRERYGDWAKPEIRTVRILYKDALTYLEVTYRSHGLFDEETKRVDLGFIIKDPEKDQPLFSAHRRAQDNAERFFDELDLYSILMTGIGALFFTKEGEMAAAKLSGASEGKPRGDILRRPLVRLK